MGAESRCRDRDLHAAPLPRKKCEDLHAAGGRWWEAVDRRGDLADSKLAKAGVEGSGLHLPL